MSRPRTPESTIKRVLGEYLSAGRKGRGKRDAASALELFESYLNSYAYESLEPAAARVFERRFNAEGREHREFCELFGPERIVPALSMFLGWFLIRKVMPRAERAAGMLRQLMEKAAPADDEDVLEGHFRVARRERGKLWLESDEDGKTYGPLAVPGCR